MDVAGVRVEARHLTRVGNPTPEGRRALRRHGATSVGARTIHVTLGPFEREAIVRAIDDRPRKFSELYAALLREPNSDPSSVMTHRSDVRGEVLPGRHTVWAPHRASRTTRPRPLNACSTGTAERHA